MGGPGGSGLVRTFLVFVDLPVHIEFRAHPMPIMSKGLILDFDMTLTNPVDRRRKRKIDGPHEVCDVRLKYSSGPPEGLSQYLELKAVGQ